VLGRWLLDLPPAAAASDTRRRQRRTSQQPSATPAASTPVATETERTAAARGERLVGWWLGSSVTPSSTAPPQDAAKALAEQKHTGLRSPAAMGSAIATLTLVPRPVAAWPSLCMLSMTAAMHVSAVLVRRHSRDTYASHSRTDCWQPCRGRGGGGHSSSGAVDLLLWCAAAAAQAVAVECCVQGWQC
jgi:hypothetical protein